MLLFVFFQKRVRVRVKKILKIGLGLGLVLGLGFNFGIGNLIGGAVGTFGSSLARRLCVYRLCLSNSSSSFKLSA